MPREFEKEIIQFFNYKWENDRNFSLKTEEDFAILSELPAEVKMRVFKDFIYHDFLYNFRKILRFKFTNQSEFISKRINCAKTQRFKTEHSDNSSHYKTLSFYKFRKFPYYDYDNPDYQAFITMFIQSLEPR